MLEKVINFFNIWVSKGKEVDVVICNILIKGLCKEGRFKDVMSLVNDMEERKLEFDKYIFSIIFSVFLNVRKMKEVEEFKERLYGLGKL